MLFNVSLLLHEQVGSVRHYTLDPSPPIHRGSVALTRLPGGILVQCRADVLVEGVCSRCLAPIGYPSGLEFEEIFAQQVDVATGAKLDSTDEPDSFLISLNHTIDITEAVRQYTEMAAAMQPLCRPDCPGICPECGADLSITGCACNRSPIDHRWAALASLDFKANG